MNRLSDERLFYLEHILGTTNWRKEVQELLDEILILQSELHDTKRWLTMEQEEHQKTRNSRDSIRSELANESKRYEFSQRAYATLDKQNFQLTSESGELHARIETLKSRLYEKSQWIDINERLPENGVKVLVLFGKIENILIGRLQWTTPHMTRQEWSVFFSDGEKLNEGENAEEITHWQPLPTL